MTVEAKMKIIQEKLNEAGISNQLKTWTNYGHQYGINNTCTIQVNSIKDVEIAMAAVEAINKSAQKHEDLVTAKGVAGYTVPLEDMASHPPFFFNQKQRDKKYSASFSLSHAAAGGQNGHVAFEFTEKFQENITFHKDDKHFNQKFRPNAAADDLVGQRKARLVTVPAGVQLHKLEEWLLAHGCCLAHPPMIERVTLIGALATGAHGTGLLGAPLGEYLYELTICLPDGTLKKMKATDPDFATLFTAHMGMAGVIVDATIRVPEKFNLKEEINNYKGLEPLKKDMPELIKKPYCTINYFPVKGEPNITVRTWTPTEEPPRNQRSYDKEAKLQEMGVYLLGDTVQSFLTQEHCKELLPKYHQLISELFIAHRGTDVVVDEASKVTHDQKAYPRGIHDVSYLIENPDNDPELINKVFSIIDELVTAAHARGEYPITYTVYARTIAATKKAGLSTTASDCPLLALDIVTHPNAPGLAAFEENFLKKLKEAGIKTRFHLGKELPHGVNSYTDCFSAEERENFRQKLEKFTSKACELNPCLNRMNREMLGLQNPAPKPMSMVKSVPLPKTALNHFWEEIAEFRKRATKFITSKLELSEREKEIITAIDDILTEAGAEQPTTRYGCTVS